MSEELHFGLFGQDIAHSLSPMIHRHHGQLTQRNINYHLLDFSPREIEEFFDGRSTYPIPHEQFVGFNVTTPFKDYFLKKVHSLTTEALQVQGVNTIKFNNGHLLGHNTDIAGIKFTFEEYQIDLSSYHVCLLGVGAANRAAALAMVKAGVKSLTWVSRNKISGKNCIDWCQKELPHTHCIWLGINEQKVHSFLTANQPHHPTLKELKYEYLQHQDIILVSGIPPQSYQQWTILAQICQTALGEYFGLSDHSYFVDLNYGAHRTTGAQEFTRHLKVEYLDGLTMLVGQAVASFNWWCQESLIAANVWSKLSKYL